MATFWGGAEANAVAPRQKKATAKSRAESEEVKIIVAAESWRFIAYLAFWGMCAFAIAMTKIFVAPLLAAGPVDEGDTCGPFNRDAPEFNVFLGKGFDMATQSHLMQLFGFANICANWDYSPSRELTAMVYPIFEYSLIVYLCLDFMTTYLHYKRGELTEWFWGFSKVAFPVNVILCAWFRMIFICIAYEQVSYHTAGFLGLQIALILVAVQNTLFIIDADIAYEWIGGIKNTRIAAISYLIATLCVSSVKVTATVYVVTHGEGAAWTLVPSPIPGKVMGQFVDMFWMFLNAVMPLIISYIRSKSEFPLEITFDIQEPKYVTPEGIEMSEGQPLRGGGSHKKYESPMDVQI
jgi:hypothetical protein